MATFPVVKIMEIVLIACHPYSYRLGNYSSDPELACTAGWLCQRQQIRNIFFSRFMIWTGATVLIFLVLHFFNFYFIKLGLVAGNPENFYSVAHNLFKIPAYNYIYLTCFALLGFHLFHAFSSAFQTLGLNHRIWTPVVKVVALIYSIVIPLGFAFISISLWLFR